MKMFYAVYVWLVAMIQNLFKGDLPAEKEEALFKPLTLDLQFFADDSDDDSDNDDDADDTDADDDDSEDQPSLDELMKNPAFKKQYNQKLKDQLSKRLKKYDGVDPEEYKRLKAEADGNKKKDSSSGDADKTDVEQQKRLLRAERREKQAVVKEFAVENGHNPKLLARLIDIEAIELDENGDPENLDELFEALEEDFPEYFGAADDEDDQEAKKAIKKNFTPGSKQKGNKKKKVDPYAAGAERAKQRHSKGDDKR